MFADYKEWNFGAIMSISIKAFDRPTQYIRTKFALESFHLTKWRHNFRLTSQAEKETRTIWFDSNKTYKTPLKVRVREKIKCPGRFFLIKFVHESKSIEC